MNSFEPNKLLSYDNESIIKEIKRVYNKFFENQRMSTKEFSRYSRVSVVTVIKRFGSWLSALQQAGVYSGEITNEKKKQIPFSEIKKDIERVIQLNHGEYFTYRFYKQNGGKYSYPTFRSRFGYKTWNDLLYKEFSLFKTRKEIVIKQQVKPLAEEVLFNEIRTVWEKIGRRPTYGEFRNNAKIGTKIFENRYGGWTNAIEAFCLLNTNYSSSSTGKGYNTTKELLTQELLKIKEMNNLIILEQDDYKKYGGEYSVATYHNHFGSWKNALHSAGLKSGRDAPTENELFDELQRIWEKLGRQPLLSEMKMLSKYYKTYSHRFGSWTKAIYAFIDDRQKEEMVIDNLEEINKSEKEEKEIIYENNVIEPIRNDIIRMKTPRSPSTRLRFLILLRDNFTCVLCGQKPSSDNSIILHIDHIFPYSKGGETLPENLRTLCSKCNLGKSDLTLENTSSNNTLATEIISTSTQINM